MVEVNQQNNRFSNLYVGLNLTLIFSINLNKVLAYKYESDIKTFSEMALSKHVWTFFKKKDPRMNFLASLLSKEWEWVSKVQSSDAGSASKLWVESLASDGSVGTNVAGESTPAGITDVDTGSHGGCKSIKQQLF